MRAARILAFLMLLAAPACTSSRWQFVRQRPSGKDTTKVTIRSEPTHAEVRLRGEYIGYTPVEVPMRYSYELKVYERREALPYPHIEKRELKTHVGNVFVFQFFKPGYARMEREITLSGEEAVDLDVTLEPISE